MVLFSTVAADTGMSFHASIATAKAAVEGLTRALAAEYAASGVRVNCIAPSLTNTPLAAALLNSPEKAEAGGQAPPPAAHRPARGFGLHRLLSALGPQLVHHRPELAVDGGMGKLK